MHSAHLPLASSSTQPAPLVSVILTTFYPRPYLGAAIQSVLGQTFPNFELIITDDANLQSTRRACQPYLADRRLTCRSNPTRLGPLLNIAAALKEARGEFVAILNDDDQLEPDMLETLVRPLLRHPQCVLAFSDHWRIDSKGAPIAGLASATSRLAQRQKLAEGMVSQPFSFSLRGGVLIGMGAVCRRSALQHEWFKPQVGGAYDLWLALQLSAIGKVYFVPRRLLRYRVHADSLSGRVDPENVRGEIFIFEALLKQAMGSEDLSFVRKQLAAFLFVLGRDRLYSNNTQGARSAFARSLRVKSGIKAVIGIVASHLSPSSVRLSCKFWRGIRRVISGQV